MGLRDWKSAAFKSELSRVHWSLCQEEQNQISHSALYQQQKGHNSFPEERESCSGTGAEWESSMASTKGSKPAENPIYGLLTMTSLLTSKVDLM